MEILINERDYGKIAIEEVIKSTIYVCKTVKVILWCGNVSLTYIFGSAIFKCENISKLRYNVAPSSSEETRTLPFIDFTACCNIF